ncbi:MAG: holo-ACP synthase [Candidatus Accumulibacter sp.]|jgi:holo-[acyl-carrier protein] synthase|nr:holo-ACP synthase [Accumulibacter sp.]
MIAGVGADIVAVARLARLYERHGARALEKLLAPAERAEFSRAVDPARFLAKRFAAKEALGKAIGTGVSAPATLPNIAVTHDALGKPSFACAPPLERHLAERGLTVHLSISDETDHALAFVVIERA